MMKSTQFLCVSSPTLLRFPFFLAGTDRFPVISVRATSSDDKEDENNAGAVSGGEGDADAFEDRLSRVQLRYRVGSGKKAELRKMRKGDASTEQKSPGMYLPAVPLMEPTSDGMKVEFGFSSYSERANGRIATLGLAALLLVELATGKSVLSYHSPAIVMTQIYFVATMGALYIKYEKEKSSLWPQ